MNIGSVISTIYCDECYAEIEVYPDLKKAECPICNNKIDLEISNFIMEEKYN